VIFVLFKYRTEASGKDSVGVPKGSMKVVDFLEMTAEDRKVVR
jgi:hypothetical protein